jgi:hypothetical protein
MKTKEDLTGKVFHRLTVIGIDADKKSKDGLSYWNCTCSCGTKRSIVGRSLTRGQTKSCGCLKAEKAVLNCKAQIGKIKPAKEDLTGRILGKLTVLRRDVGKIGLVRGSFWICSCSCGNIRSISRQGLVNHGTKSCGCLVREVAAKNAMPDGGADKNHWLGKYKRRAKELGIEFSLTPEEFYDICSMNCFYCDAAPTHKSNGHKHVIEQKNLYKANGIDRVDPNIGYTKENGVPCCKVCNFMKTDKSQQFFIDKMIEIVSNLRRKHVIQSS